MAKRIFLPLILAAPVAYLICCVGNAFFSHAQGKPSSRMIRNKSLIGRIKDDSVAEGCGCFFSLPYENKKRFPRYVFISPLDEKNAWMNIEGKDEKLKLIHSAEVRGREKIGSRQSRTYVAEGIKVVVVYITTRLCKPHDEDCESADYDASLTVMKGGRRQTVDLKGGCGC